MEPLLTTHHVVDRDSSKVIEILQGVQTDGRPDVSITLLLPSLVDASNSELADALRELLGHADQD